MAKQLRYTTAQTVTQNVTRVESITYFPTRDDGAGSRGIIEVVYAIGEDNGTTFTRNDTDVLQVTFADLNATLQATFDDLESKALAVGQNQGLFPSGSEEAL